MGAFIALTPKDNGNEERRQQALEELRQEWNCLPCHLELEGITYALYCLYLNADEANDMVRKLKAQPFDLNHDTYYSVATIDDTGIETALMRQNAELVTEAVRRITACRMPAQEMNR